MNLNPRFPYRLFIWFIRWQIFLAIVGLGSLSLALFIAIGNFQLNDEVIWASRQAAFLAIVFSAVLVVGISIFMARRMMIPLGRLIQKTRRLHQFPFEDDETAREDMAYDEPGEWYDLERALNELAKDLQSKTIRLSREKTELRAIMSSVKEGVLAINTELRPLFYNSQFALTFNIAALAISDVKIGDITRDPEILNAFETCLSEGVSRKIEMTLDQYFETPRVLQISIAPLLKKHNDEIYGAVAIFNDITEIRRAEKMRVEFVGNVSHELRTPLTSIRGYVQTLVSDVKAQKFDQCLDFLKIVERNTEKLMGLVEDLLNLSSLQAGVELKFSPVDLERLTQGVLQQVDIRLHQINVQYGVKKMIADELRVEQVLRNLVQNAVRYVPAGGKIDIEWLTQNSSKIVFKISDNGPGILPEHQTRIFERFYRADESRNSKDGGAGIGLALVKHIMQLHGGQILLKSQVGRGSEFICEFPQ